MIYSKEIQKKYKPLLNTNPELYPGYRNHYETVHFIQKLFKTIKTKDENFTPSPHHPTIKRVESISLNNITIYSCNKKNDYYHEYPFAGYEIIGPDYYFFISITMHTNYSSLLLHSFTMPEPIDESRLFFTQLGLMIYKNYCEVYSLKNQILKINNYLENLSVAEQGTLLLDIEQPQGYIFSYPNSYLDIGFHKRLVGNLWRNATEFFFYSTDNQHNNFSSSGSICRSQYPILSTGLKRKLSLNIPTLENFFDVFRHLFHYCNDGSKLELSLHDFKISKAVLIKGKTRKTILNNIDL